MPKSKNKYALPALPREITRIVSDPESHAGWSQYAVDFCVPEGTNVNASCDGMIVFIKTDSSQGGDDPKYEDFKYYNHLVLKHNNGEYTEYGHLLPTGCFKKVGDKVKKGVTIALSGNTGWSSEPHIHFAVFRLKNMPNDFAELPKGKKYFIDDEEFGYETIEPDLDQIVKIEAQ